MQVKYKQQSIKGEEANETMGMVSRLAEDHCMMSEEISHEAHISAVSISNQNFMQSN
jgi:hypothetical protein